MATRTLNSDRPRRPLVHAAALAGVAVLVAACSAPPDPSREPKAPEEKGQSEQDQADQGQAKPTPSLRPQPKTGQCYDVKPAALKKRQDTSSPVACTEPHNVEVVGTETSKQPITPKNVDTFAKTCQTSFASYVGGSEAVSRVKLSFLVATEKEQKQGRHWIACVAGVAEDTEGTAVERRTSSVKGALDGEVSPTLRACLGDPVDPEAKQTYVPCGDPHVAELLPSPASIGAADESYPSAKVVDERARNACADIATEAGVPAGARRSWVVPDEKEWGTGVRSAACWVTAQLPGITAPSPGTPDSPESPTPPGTPGSGAEETTPGGPTPGGSAPDESAPGDSTPGGTPQPGPAGQPTAEADR